MNFRRTSISALVLLVIIVGVYVAYGYYRQSTLYLKTDNAQVTGQEIAIAAPTAGKLVNWRGQDNATFQAGETVGQVEVATARGMTNMAITMPQGGTIVETMAATNEFVGPGTPLAYAFNLHDLWIGANIKETDITQVKPGQKVDVSVDALPGANLKGTVDQVGRATASTFSLLPSTGTTANFTKVTQVIPVKITLQGSASQLSQLTPGMSATVAIHRTA